MAHHDGTRRLRALACSALAAGVVFASPGSAHAEEVTPTAKGVVGGALLGGELVVFGEALFGVRSTAAYLIGGAAGAAAGGVGGYFIEQAVDDGRVPAYMLAGGLALLIPAVVVALDQTRYMPAAGTREEQQPLFVPVSEPGTPGGSSVVGAEPDTPSSSAPGPGSATTPTTAEPAPAPDPAPSGGGDPPAPEMGPRTGPESSLFHVREKTLRLGVPMPEVRPVLGARERARMGADSRGSELRFPVVRVIF